LWLKNIPILISAICLLFFYKPQKYMSEILYNPPVENTSSTVIKAIEQCTDLFDLPPISKAPEGTTLIKTLRTASKTRGPNS
jgi:hypothetical protein